ncbi:MAG: hypothetical protein IJ588_13780 [Prevotella sp.]|nr:hypothetical protein [Prevotella sp.]
MIIGSHNSWSYLRPAKWWMHLIAFTARCQCVDIHTQYEQYGVRCFDLRVRFEGTGVRLVHGHVAYKGSPDADLTFLNERGDCSVRLILDTRTRKPYLAQRDAFRAYCDFVACLYHSIRFWCFRNLYDWQQEVPSLEPSCEERYASVQPPRLLDDWFPWLYARLHNHRNISAGTEKEILLIDYVNIR